MKKKDPTSHRIIEKRRRDRMNNCLADLSKLIPVHYMKKGRGRVEKTEIIEMAIKHLKDLIEATNAQQQSSNPLLQPQQNRPAQQQQQPPPPPPPPSALNSANLETQSSDTYQGKTTLNPNSPMISPSIGNNLIVPATAAAAGAITTSSDIIEDLQQFPTSPNLETNGYINHHQHNQPNHQQYQNTHSNSYNINNSDKNYRSSPTPSSNGSDSSSSSSSSSSLCSIGSNLSNGSIHDSNGCCGACGANMLNGSGDSRASGSSSDASSGSSNISRSTTAWYKKAWLVRSFTRAQQQRSSDSA